MTDLDAATDTRTEADPARTSAWTPGRVAIYVGAVVTAFFLVRVLGAPWPHFPPTYPDSGSYLTVARIGPFHPRFYFTERPIGYPLLLWLVGRSSTLAVVSQTLLYVASFWLLCALVARRLTSKVIAGIAIVFIAALAIEPRNALWNDVILSESLSSSLAVISIAAWFAAAARATRRSVIVAWCATAAWLLVRDTNVLPTVTVLIPAAYLIAVFAKRTAWPVRRALAVGATVMLVVCGYVYVSQAASHRTVYSIYNNVGVRVLPDAGATQWWVDQGMPIDDTVRGRAGHSAWDDGNKSWLDDPALAHFRSWAKSSGGRVLAESMLLRAPQYWKQLHHQLPGILKYDDAVYDSYNVRQRLPKTWPAPLGTPTTTGGLFIGLVLAVAGIAIAATDRRRRPFAIFAGVLLASAFVDIWASWIGDPLEDQRHLVGPLLRLSLMLILSIAIGADSAWARWKPRAATPDGPAALDEVHETDEDAPVPENSSETAAATATAAPARIDPDD